MPGQNYPHECLKSNPHPFGGNRKFIRISVRIMEMKLGRALNQDEVVHHLDGNPWNNAKGNLRLMKKRDHDRLNSMLMVRDQKGRFHKKRTCV